MSFNYHLITNVGTLMKSDFAKRYPSMLCLSQLYEKHEGYRRILKAKVALGDRLILDNGAHEGFDVDLDAYMAVAIDLQPTVVILTDLVGRNYMASRERSLRFVKLADDNGKLPGARFMYAAQGESRDQVLADYEWALANLSPERFIIGFGQGYLQWASTDDEVNAEATRVPMVEAVMRMPYADRHDFHVLGARWSADDSDYGRFERICGIDTIKPVTCASHGTLYPDRPPFRCVDRMSEETVDEDLMIDNVHCFCQEYGCEIG